MITNIECFFILILISIIICNINKRIDVISPANIFLCSFLICSTAYISIYDFWKVDLSFETFALMTSSCLLFIITSKIIDVLFSKYYKIQRNTLADIEYNKISRLAYCFMLAISIIYIVSGFHNISVYGSMEYKNILSTNNLSGHYFSIQVNKLVYAFSYVGLYEIVTNLVGKKYNIRSQLLAIITVLFCNFAFSITVMSRQNFIEFVVAFFIIWIVFKRDCGSFSFKNIINIISIVLIIPVMFFYSSELVGRDFTRISTYGIQKYVSIYMSCGINYFNREIITHPFSTEYFGQSSFAGLFKNFIGILVPDNVQDMTKHAYSIDYGNTVTIFGRWFEDGGYIMVIFMTILLAGSATYFYNKYLKFGRKSPIGLILYAKYVGILLWAGYDNRLALSLSLDQIQQIVYIYILFHLLLKTRIKIRI